MRRPFSSKTERRRPEGVQIQTDGTVRRRLGGGKGVGGGTEKGGLARAAPDPNGVAGSVNQSKQQTNLHLFGLSPRRRPCGCCRCCCRYRPMPQAAGRASWQRQAEDRRGLRHRPGSASSALANPGVGFPRPPRRSQGCRRRLRRRGRSPPQPLRSRRRRLLLQLSCRASDSDACDGR